MLETFSRTTSRAPGALRSWSTSSLNVFLGADVVARRRGRQRLDLPHDRQCLFRVIRSFASRREHVAVQ